MNSSNPLTIPSTNAFFQHAHLERDQNNGDVPKEVDVVSLGKSIRVAFRNHELLNAVMLRENEQILRVLLTNDIQRMVYLLKDKVCARMLNDLHTPLDQIGPEDDTELQSIAVSNDDRYLAVGLTKGDQNELRVLSIGTLEEEKTFSYFESLGTIGYIQFSPED